MAYPQQSATACADGTAAKALADNGPGSANASVPHSEQLVQRAAARRLSAPAPLTFSAADRPSAAAGSRVQSKVRRVSFGGVVKIRLDQNGVGIHCQTAEELRPSDGGKYYPGELAKLPPSERTPPWWNAHVSFCRCSRGCGARCPCAKNGIGCWFESGVGEDGASLDWGCGCGMQCTAAVAGYRCDLNAVWRVRRARLSELTPPPVVRTPTATMRAVPRAAASVGQKRAADEALTLDELADERRVQSCPEMLMPRSAISAAAAPLPPYHQPEPLPSPQPLCTPVAPLRATARLSLSASSAEQKQRPADEAITLDELADERSVRTAPR